MGSRLEWYNSEMGEGLSLHSEIINDGGIAGINSAFLERVQDFLLNWGFPKDWYAGTHRDPGYDYYFAPRIWGETGLWLGTNIASEEFDDGFIIAKAPNTKRVEVAIIETAGGAKIWWDKRLTVNEAIDALSEMERRIEIQKDVYDEQFEELQN